MQKCPFEFCPKSAGKPGSEMREAVRRLLLLSAVLIAPVAVVGQTNQANLISQNPRADWVEAPTSLLPDAPGSRPIAASADVQATGQPSSNGNSTTTGQESAQQASAQGEVSANIAGSVLDTNGDTVGGATVVLRPPKGEDRTTIADENGAFQFSGLRPGTPYLITIAVTDFEPWKSEPIVLTPGQFYFMVDIKLKVAASVTSVTVSASNEQIATEQVELQEKQRVFGIIPNFYVTYDAHPVPLTTKLKYKLAYRADDRSRNFFWNIFSGHDLPGG